ncbi:hypothetical protein EV356DRAFT_219938 [Viridothelium virens]|uniref:Uncharacterized protein n=1 Tax=Viridothelium virens TaxID=1048519 RepID=A0A6A6HKY9_VIRVR|nr:hypothetical protein EV356DRAFT_219938 [Viridothelium virens]
MDKSTDLPFTCFQFFPSSILINLIFGIYVPALEFGKGGSEGRGHMCAWKSSNRGAEVGPALRQQMGILNVTALAKA